MKTHRVLSGYADKENFDELKMYVEIVFLPKLLDSLRRNRLM